MSTPSFSEDAVARFLIFLIVAGLIIFAIRLIFRAPAREGMFAETAITNQPR